MSLPRRDPVSEALVIVDLVGSTQQIMLHGWHAVGRAMIDDLRYCIAEIKPRYGLRCQKFTGDGYLLTFFTRDDTEQAVIKALHAVIAISRAVAQRTQHLSKQRQLRLRFALHYGEVDAIEEDRDREGPNVAYIFRMEGVDADALKRLDDGTSAFTFPDDNYAILSEQVVEILERSQRVYDWEPLPALRLRGFSSAHFLYLLRDVMSLRHDM